MIEGRLEIGTKVYYVREDNNVFSRKKIFMKDTDGVEWYRYDTPLRSHAMSEHTIVGRVLKDVEGRVPSIENHLDEYYLESGEMVDANDIDESDAWCGYFLNKDEAIEWINIRKEISESIERS